MEVVKFTITVTPPLVDTVDIGHSTFDGLSFVIEKRILPFPQSTEDRERARKLGRRSDIGVFSFGIDSLKALSVCHEIATRILRASSSNTKDLKIMIEGKQAEAIIFLPDYDTNQLADQIYALVTSSSTTP